MKTLLLLRHAKSSWNNAMLSDHDRPLNDRGLQDAPRMGRLLHSEDLVPDLIISSTARRAADTADAVALAAGYEGDITYTGRLYHAEPETYLALAAKLDDAVDRVLMIGHNPGLEELVEDLSGHAERMPTAALATFQIDINTWRDLSAEAPFTLTQVWVPKALR
jgi:phosphohistidine phosphatase